MHAYRFGTPKARWHASLFAFTFVATVQYRSEYRAAALCSTQCAGTFSVIIENDLLCVYGSVFRKANVTTDALVFFVPGTGHTFCDYEWLFQHANATFMAALPRVNKCGDVHYNMVCDADLLMADTLVRSSQYWNRAVGPSTILASHSVGAQTTFKSVSGVARHDAAHVRLLALSPWGIQVHMMQMLYLPYVFVVSNGDCTQSFHELHTLSVLSPAQRTVVVFWNSSHGQWPIPSRVVPTYTNPLWCTGLLPAAVQHTSTRDLVDQLVREELISDSRWTVSDDWLYHVYNAARPCNCCNPYTWRTGMNGYDIMCRTHSRFPF